MGTTGDERLGQSGIDPEEAADLLLRDLRSSRDGLSSAEARRRLLQYGRNELQRRGGLRWPTELARQLTHPLALLLWLAAALLLIVGSDVVASAVILIILLNAAFAFVQEVQAERAVEALARYLPHRTKTLRDGEVVEIDAAELVPGDIVVIEEGDRIAADVRLLAGAIEADMSALTGESVPILRSAAMVDVNVPVLRAHDLVFSGTNCAGGEARGVVFAIGMATELGRIAALTQRVKQEPSPLEQQVRRVAWLIAGVSVALAFAFIPIGIFGAHLSLTEAVVFAAGLLAGMVPEGLLPVITLALAVAVRRLVAKGALVKRLSAVETLGSTDVICTDKTGTLTENQMRPMALWTDGGVIELDKAGNLTREASGAAAHAAGAVAAACNNAKLEPHEEPKGDPTEVAVLLAAQALGVNPDAKQREARRRWQFHFDPALKLMSTIDQVGEDLVVHTKGAPEALLPLCTAILDAAGDQVPLGDAGRARVTTQANDFASDGLRVLALAQRVLPKGTRPPHQRGEAERDFCFVALIAMLDPPRPEVAEAVARCRTAGIRIIVITGDHPLTAAAIARRVGIAGDHPRLVTGDEIEGLDEHQIGQIVRDEPEVIFARASPETKLHIADALRSQGMS